MISFIRGEKNSILMKCDDINRRKEVIFKTMKN
jgi:hypothetical protein